MLQRLTAVMQDVGRNDVRMQGKANTGQAQTTDFLDHHGAVEEVGRHATVFLRQVRTEHSRLPRLVPEGAVDIALLLPLGMERHGFFLEELAHAIAKQFMFGAEQRSWNHAGTWVNREWFTETKPRFRRGTLDTSAKK
ncbi:hypothetical protein D3C75_874780 [compost metagenome]